MYKTNINSREDKMIPVNAIKNLTVNSAGKPVLQCCLAISIGSLQPISISCCRVAHCSYHSSMAVLTCSELHQLVIFCHLVLTVRVSDVRRKNTVQNTKKIYLHFVTASFLTSAPSIPHSSQKKRETKSI